ncbi:MAG: ComF family protein, partial [Clostridia bacterium]|nr:ComF family protein [Clostridia bacterium]
NVLNPFACPEKVFGGVVILVDDMVTTGATVNEVARTLKSSGFDKVLVLSLASADKRN